MAVRPSSTPPSTTTHCRRRLAPDRHHQVTQVRERRSGSDCREPQACRYQRAGEVRARTNNEQTRGAVGEAMWIEVRSRTNANHMARMPTSAYVATITRRHATRQPPPATRTRCTSTGNVESDRQHRGSPESRAAFPAFPRGANQTKPAAIDSPPTSRSHAHAMRPAAISAQTSRDEQRGGKLRAAGVCRELSRTMGDRPHRDAAGQSDRGDSEPGDVGGCEP